MLLRWSSSVDPRGNSGSTDAHTVVLMGTVVDTSFGDAVSIWQGKAADSLASSTGTTGSTSASLSTPRAWQVIPAIDVINTAGYTGTIRIQSGSIEAWSDIQNAPPGQVDIYLTVPDVQVTLTNTTKGRIWSPSSFNTYVRVFGVWPASSIVCAGRSDKAAGGCFVSLYGGNAPDGSQELALDYQVPVTLEQPASPGAFTRLPEKDAATFTSELVEGPSYVAVVVGAGMSLKTTLSNCPDADWGLNKLPVWSSGPSPCKKRG